MNHRSSGTFRFCFLISSRPVYRDTNQMAGRRISYLSAVPENDFLPMPDQKQKADIIYLCSPNNPTGNVYRKEQLSQ